jgi:hypothetical protein
MCGETKRVAGWIDREIGETETEVNEDERKDYKRNVADV